MEGAKKSDYPVLAQFRIDFIFLYRGAKADVTDLLDLATYAELASWPGDEIRDTVHHKGEQGGDTQYSEPEAETSPRSGMHEIPHQQARRHSEDYRCREGAAFHPGRGRVRMRV
jgi:hypothetical protein